MNVLFVCVGNQGRSVMAQRLFERAARGDNAARSAGSSPGDVPHPQVVEALREVGIDASDHVPHKLNDADLEWADLAVSVCGDEVCPVTPGVERIRWNIPDPLDMPIEQVREVRDEIGRRVEALAREL
jgi:ArsR family transcriptional regulator